MKSLRNSKAGFPGPGFWRFFPPLRPSKSPLLKFPFRGPGFFRPLSRTPLSQGGWTLIELMLVAAMIAIITPAITFLFLKVSQGLAADEMRSQMTKGNEAMMDRLALRLSASKHLYQGGTGMGASFVADIQFVSAPETVAGTVLPQAQGQTVSLDPTQPGFGTTLVGNSLFFGAYDSPQTFVKGTSTTVVGAPLTVFGSGITDSYGTPMTFVIDLYRFYYYYLTRSTHSFVSGEGVTAYGLEEWESNQYLDIGELNSIPDIVAQNNAVSFILSQGLTYAWDSSQEAVTSAFYKITFSNPVNSAPASFVPLTAVTITQASVSFSTGSAAGTFIQPPTYLTQVSQGMMSSGFSYGISPNTSGWKDAPPVAVPQYAAASGSFPGGFEVVVGGTPAGRRVLLRSCWVAKGGAPKVIYNDLTSIETVKDNW
jgi:type II secretory pathway pseudopilin PulG